MDINVKQLLELAIENNEYHTAAYVFVEMCKECVSSSLRDVNTTISKTLKSLPDTALYIILAKDEYATISQVCREELHLRRATKNIVNKF